MSRIYVDRISPYQSGSITIDGYQAEINTGSFATTGSNTFNGNQTVNGNGTINGTTGSPIQTFTVKDGNNTARLQVNNNVLAGLVNQDLLLNGNTLITGKSSLTGSLEVSQNGEIKGTTGTPGLTFMVRDGNNTSKIEVNNSTLKGFTNVDVFLNGTVLIEDAIGLRNNDPLPTPPASAGGSLAVSGSNLYFHNGTSWTQIN